MNKVKNLTIVLMCILLSVTVSTVASAQEYSDEIAWTFLGFGLLACIVPIIWLIIAILIAIWVYRDAEKRGSSGALWLIIVIFTGIIGLIIWLVVRPPIGGHPKQQGSGTGRMCPNCGRPIPMDAQVCPYCGKNFKE